MTWNEWQELKWNELEIKMKRTWNENEWTWNWNGPKWIENEIKWHETANPKLLPRCHLFNTFATVSFKFCQPHLPKVLRPPHFTVFMWRRALPTGSCISPGPHLPRALWDPQFSFEDLRSNQASYSLALGLPTPSSKRAPNASGLSLESCALFCRQLLHMEARNRGNGDPT